MNTKNHCTIDAFYTKDYSPSSRKIILTDEIFKLRDTAFFDNFTGETELCWRLVETTWEQRIAANLLEIKYTEMGDLLYITAKKYHRKAFTSARAALNGYQKGKFCYCHAGISIGEPAGPAADIVEENEDGTWGSEGPGLLRVSEKAPCTVTLMLQTGALAADRIDSLQKMDAYAIECLVQR